MIAAPNTKDNVHLDVLSRLSVLLMDEEFTGKLRNAKTTEEFLSYVDAAEQEKLAAETAKEEAAAQPEASEKKGLKLLGVTACPTGIAHTYMAAEALEKKAKELGFSIKVETRGSGGAKNVLTDAEIAAADCIIVCVDTNVPMDRFDGKKVIIRQVSDGINKAEELLRLAESGNVEIYRSGSKPVAAASGGGKEGIGHKVYKDLMNGVSHMLPFVVGGGILIAIAFLIDGMSVDLSALAPEERANFGTITSAAALFKGIGGAAFGFMLPILAGFIAMSIADRPGLVVGFVGGSIAASGKSGFLGALVAGFLAGYLVIGLKKALEKLPESLDGIKTILLYPLLGVFFMGIIMNYLIEPPVGALNTLLNNGLSSMNGTSSVLLGIIFYFRRSHSLCGVRSLACNSSHDGGLWCSRSCFYGI